MNILSLIVGVILNLFGGVSSPERMQQHQKPTPSQKQQKTITYNNTSYGYSMLGPIPRTSITLYSNLPVKKTGKEIQEIYQCKYLINGGFYTKENTHLGLLVTEEGTKSQRIKHSLFHGFFFKTNDGSIHIDRMIPEKPLGFALQSGPLLIVKGEPVILKIIQDEQARRIAVGLDEFSNVYFFAFYDTNNPFHGPFLADMPEILQKTGEAEGIAIQNAINLDGGSHSAFYGSDITLTELSPIGSFFCIKSRIDR